MSDKVNDDDDCPERRVEHKSVKTNFLLEILQTKLLFFVILNKMMQHWNFFFHFNDVICRMTFMFGWMWKIIDVLHMLHTHIRFWHFLLTLSLTHSLYLSFSFTFDSLYAKINVQHFFWNVESATRSLLPFVQYHFTIYPQCISHIFGFEVIRYFSWHFWNCHKMKSHIRYYMRILVWALQSIIYHDMIYIFVD